MIDRTDLDGAEPSRDTQAPTPPPEPAGVSMMITRRQRAALAALGVSEEAIRMMTPAEAHARLGLAADDVPGADAPDV